MASSYLDPALVRMATEPAAPPWDWNPGATFVRAFNDAQENKRAQEKMAMERELSAILFPQKRAEAEFNIKKLAYDSKLLENSYRAQTAELDERYRIAAGGGSGSSGGGTSGAGDIVDVSGFSFSQRKSNTAPNTASNSSKVKLP